MLYRFFHLLYQQEMYLFDYDENRVQLPGLCIIIISEEYFLKKKKPGIVRRVPSSSRVVFIALGKSSTSICLNSPLIHVHRITFPSLPAEQKRG